MDAGHNKKNPTKNILGSINPKQKLLTLDSKKY
jgi:hypothetical protein